MLNYTSLIQDNQVIKPDIAMSGLIVWLFFTCPALGGQADHNHEVVCTLPADEIEMKDVVPRPQAFFFVWMFVSLSPVAAGAFLVLLHICKYFAPLPQLLFIV